MKKNLFIYLSFVSLAFYSQVPAYIPTASLVAYYGFNGNANDLSGNSNNGTVVGATLTTDRFSNANSAYNFNGTSNYISAPSGSLTTLNVLGNVSYAFWFKTATAASQGLVSFGDNISGTGGYLSSINGGNVGLTKVGVSNSNSWVASSSTLTNNNWNHAAVVVNNGTLSLYINNILEGTNISAPATLSWNGTRAIGCRNDYFNGFIQGNIDDIGVWSRELTRCEINQIFTGTISAINATSSSSLICAGQSVTLTSAGATNYTWNPGGVGASIIVSPTITSNYSITGTHSLTGCTNTMVITQSVSACAGITEANENSDISIFPNPSNNHLNVNFFNGSGGKIILINSIGVKVIDLELVNGSNLINSNALVPGIYYYSIFKNKNVIYTGKIVIE